MPFLEIKTRRDLAEELGTTDKKLAYIIYKIPDSSRYRRFELPKKSGGTRVITAPNGQLKSLQRQLATKLLEVYPNRREVNGFVKGKNTYSNAKMHLRRRWIVNLDLEDFFPSIHFGRVKGMFRARPFMFDEILSRELANLCCCDHSLPQGAPTSPVISNFICWKMDNQLRHFAKTNRCTYSRYADDITFSSNRKELPREIGEIDAEGCLHLSEELLAIIEGNKFKVNKKKVRYAFRNNRQEVTGLIVNESSPNVRRTFVRKVRAMLHACEKYGVDAAAKEHFDKYAINKQTANISIAFMNELVGRAGYIRYVKRVIKEDTWEDSPVYRSIHERIKAIFPEAQMSPTRQFVAESDRPLILGEGKTDWKILKRALEELQGKGFFADLQIRFREYEDQESVGCANLLEFCKQSAMLRPMNKVICIFDGDLTQSVYNTVRTAQKPYRNWGYNVFSLVLPKPSNRSRREISIEQYFSDDEIKTSDVAGRRLFISDEFDSETGIHKSIPTISFKGKLSVFKRLYPFIIDNSVLDSDGNSLALSKSDFANSILNQVEPFNGLDFKNFELVFEAIREILYTHE